MLPPPQLLSETNPLGLSYCTVRGRTVTAVTRSRDQLLQTVTMEQSRLGATGPNCDNRAGLK